MYFPALLLGLRRLGRWFVYELFQVALWMAYALRMPGGLRSAFGGGGAAGHRLGPAIRPRRSAGPVRGGRFGRPATA